jgi:tetratricopeptide (TPR) repeat protein
MMKWLMYLVLAALVGGSWMLYSKNSKETADLKVKIQAVEETGDPDGQLEKMNSELQSLEGGQTFNGILLAFLGAGLVGIFFVLNVLPFFAQRLTHAVYDSGEVVEKDVMHDARSLMAQGEYEAAIEAFRQAALADPLNRLPWVEISKIQKDNLDDSAAAIQTIRQALETQSWEINDAAYFLFRLAELYDEVNGDRASAMAIMQQVIDQFPGTRHSANASHKLHEWSVAAAEAEEQQFVQQQGGNRSA